MKKTYKLLMPILLLLIVSGPMLETANAQDARKISFDITFHFELGRKSKGCTGFGLCFIVLTDVNFDGLARFQPKTKELQFEFPLEVTKKHPEQFENDIFIQEEDLQLSKEISLELGSDRPLLIPKGEYSLKRSAKTLILNVPQK